MSGKWASCPEADWKRKITDAEAADEARGGRSTGRGKPLPGGVTLWKGVMRGAQRRRKGKGSIVPRVSAHLRGMKKGGGFPEKSVT